MSTRLVILGLLRERSLYGYEIKQIIEEHMGDWTSIAFGSIYFALDKLAEEAYVEKIGIEQPGNRPSRSVYQISAAGRDEFKRLLHETWAEVERTYFSIDIGIFFMDALSPQEVQGYLRKRIAMLEGVLRHLDEHQEEEMQIPDVPHRATAIFSHTVLHTRAELEWTRNLLESVQKGDFL